MANRPRFWAPDSHAERRPFLITRGEVARAVRDLFGVLEFVEVETATLQVSPGNETHIHAMRTDCHRLRDRLFVGLTLAGLRVTETALRVRSRYRERKGRSGSTSDHHRPVGDAQGDEAAR